MSYYVVDRIEGKTAVIIADDGGTLEVAARELPTGCREGTVLRIEVTGGGVDWSRAQIDTAERDRRLKAAKQKLDQLRKSDPGGDIEL